MKDIHSFVILAYNESDDLEECIKSIKKQSIKSNVFIATSTKNDHIMELASEYGLGVMINDCKSNKGSDYNFAFNSVDTRLLTIVHQDDLYDRNYAKEIIKCYKKNKSASIIFTDYYEILCDKKIKYSKNLFKKRLFIWLLQYDFFNKRKYFRRLALKYQNAICTSSVTFVKNNIKKDLQEDIFPIDVEFHNDWAGFEKLSLINRKFVYLPMKLVGYRINKEKIKNKKEIEEDILIYKKFWPSKLIDFIYRKKLNKESGEIIEESQEEVK